MQLTKKDVLRGLLKLGAISQGSRHKKCKVVIDGKCVSVFTVPSNDNYDDVLIGFVSRPLAVGHHEFGDICKCTKGLDWYRAHLAGSGKL